MNCSKCQSVNVIKITYGTPSLDDKEMIARIKSGFVVLGGCVIDEDSPAYHCKNCKYRFGNYMETRNRIK